MYKKWKLFGSSVLLHLSVLAQSDTTDQHALDKTPASAISWSGYVESYYGYDFNKPKDNLLPAFYYNYNRHNEFNINLAYLKSSYSTDRVRANLAVGFGTYMNANYSSEPGVLKNIFEANVGFRLSAKKNLWIDAGILPSHIGWESAIGKDDWTLTRSIAAEGSPYFESGARLSYTNTNGKWYLSLMGLNGWQRITRSPGNSLMSWGTQVQFKPNSEVLFNYSTFIGSDKPDSARRWRYFQDFYSVIQINEQIGITAGFDYGLEQAHKGSHQLYSWYTPAIILRYTPVRQWAFVVRGEYYADPKGVMIPESNPDGFRTFGYSLNLDYHPVENISLRLEGKTLKSRDDIFLKGDENTTSRFTAMTASIALSF